MPLVSVVIPTYNYGRYLPNTIDSVLAQTLSDHEIIVIDDGSSDDTGDVLRRYGDRVISRRQKNAGLPAARNSGCALARGEFIAFLDADDAWLPDKLEKQVRILQEKPDVGMVCGWMNRIDVAGNLLPGTKPNDPPGETVAEMLERGTALPSTWLARRSCLEKLGGFDEDLISMDDYDFAIRMAAEFRVICTSDVVGNYRVHSDSLSHHGEMMFLGYVQSFDKLLEGSHDRRVRALAHRKRAQYRYRLAKIRLANGEIASSRRLIAQALGEAPALAWPEGGSSPLHRRILQAIRPYSFLAALCVAPAAVRARAKNDVSY